jgi:hypothetical protein
MPGRACANDARLSGFVGGLGWINVMRNAPTVEHVGRVSDMRHQKQPVGRKKVSAAELTKRNPYSQPRATALERETYARHR